MREKSPTAFVTVQRGCDYRCTFCIVPFTRGPERSRRLEDVVREVEALAARRHHRGDAARSDGQQLPRRPARFRRPAPRGRRGGRHPAAAVHEPVSDRVHRARSSTPWPRRRPSASTCTCRCRAGRTRCSGACCAATPASATWRWWRALRPRDSRHHLLDRHHRRLPRRDRGAVRGDAEPRHRCGFRRRLYLQVLGPRGHAGGAPARPCRRTTWRRPGSSGSSRPSARNTRRKNVARVGEMHEVLVERPARRGDLMLGRTRTNQLVLLDLPPSAIGEYHTVSAHRHHRLHLHRRGRRARTGGPVIHNLVEEHVRGLVRVAAAALPGLLRLRRLSRRMPWCTRSTGCRRVRVQPAGIGDHRGEPGEGSEPRGHRRRDDGRRSGGSRWRRAAARSAARASLSRAGRGEAAAGDSVHVAYGAGLATGLLRFGDPLGASWLVLAAALRG